MPHHVDVRADLPVLQELVAAWLADARIRVPNGVGLKIEVGVIEPFESASAALMTQGRVLTYRDEDTRELTLVWADTLGRATIAQGSTTAHVCLSEEGLLNASEMLRSFLLNCCILLFQRAGMHHVHGAALRDPTHRDWLITGVSGSGKSTTSALLARNGWLVGTDDIAFLAANEANDRTDLVAWRERLALRADAVISTGHTGGMELTTRSKTGWFVEELGTEWIDRVTPSILAFPTVRADAPTTASPLTAKQALFRVMEHSPWVYLQTDRAAEHLELMSRLVRQSRAFDLSLGRDIFTHPNRLMELVA